MKTLTATNLRNKFGNEIEHFTDEMLTEMIRLLWLDKTIYTDTDLLGYILSWGLFENFVDAAEHYEITLDEWDACDREEEARRKLNERFVFVTLDNEDYRVMLRNPEQ